MPAAALPRLCAFAFAALALAISDARATEPTPLEPSARAALVDAARQTQSSALVVMHRGKILVEDHFGEPVEPIEAMSVTKSVVNLALGALHAEGRISSLDQPVHDYFPEWKQGRKQHITLRHLMAHTSGLQNVRDTNVEIYPSPDFVRLALAAELDDEPGARFAYNNKTLNLIPAIVQQLSGLRIDAYLRQGLFRELGITRFTWSLDAAGNAHGMSGLQILPADLALLGQLMLQRGEWQGKTLVRPEWIEQSLLPAHADAPQSGLLWWRIPARESFVLDAAHVETLRQAGIASAFLDRFAPAFGRHEGRPAWEAALRRALGEDWQAVGSAAMAPAREQRMSLSRREYEGLAGYAGRGYLGQYLVVLPEVEIVAVRMITERRHRFEDPNNFPRFEAMVRALVP